jgi:hypothetical protein
MTVKNKKSEKSEDGINRRIMESVSEKKETTKEKNSANTKGSANSCDIHMG